MKSWAHKQAIDKKLKSLLALSDVKGADQSQFYAAIENAPDPETAVVDVIARVKTNSIVLTRQWRNFVTNIWLNFHPEVPFMPNWPLSINEVAFGPNLRDALTFLRLLTQSPAKMVSGEGEWLMASEDVARFVKNIPSFLDQAISGVESEWSYVVLRRLREQLMAAGLVRVRSGELLLVKSKINRFLNLPAVQQMYVLWHADTYHVDWEPFAGLWRNHLGVIQEYLPLFWETIGEVEVNQVEDRAQWAIKIIETFIPLWEEEGLFDASRGPKFALQAIQQQALPTIVDRFILRDLFEKHGLVRLGDTFGALSRFSWTSAGAKIVAAEQDQKLPCGQDLLLG